MYDNMDQLRHTVFSAQGGVSRVTSYKEVHPPGCIEDSAEWLMPCHTEAWNQLRALAVTR